MSLIKFNFIIIKHCHWFKLSLFHLSCFTKIFKFERELKKTKKKHYWSVCHFSENLWFWWLTDFKYRMTRYPKMVVNGSKQIWKLLKSLILSLLCKCMTDFGTSDAACVCVCADMNWHGCAFIRLYCKTHIIRCELADVPSCVGEPRAALLLPGHQLFLQSGARRMFPRRRTWEALLRLCPASPMNGGPCVNQGVVADVWRRGW